jgi:hypothetical protein
MIKEIEMQNRQLMNLKGKFGQAGNPYQNSLQEKIELIEKKMFEAKK